jgi:hypothetical protein
MANAHCPLRDNRTDVCFEIGDLSLTLVDQHLTLWLYCGHTGAVVTSVFKAFQAIDQDGVSGLRPEVTYDSTHG